MFAMPRKDLKNRLFEVAVEQYGYVTTKDARRLRINPVELPKMAARGHLERIAHGLYRFPLFPRDPLDPYMEAVLWADGRGILSHETALAVYSLADVNPPRIHVTVPGDYNPRRAGGQRYAIHRRDLPEEDVTRHEAIPIVTPRRALWDIIAGRLTPHLADQAIRQARARGLIREDEAARLRKALLSSVTGGFR